MFVSKKKYKKLEEDYNKLLEISSLPPLEKIEVFKNNIEIKFGSPMEALTAWAQIITKAFIDAGAENYIEMVLGGGKDKYVFTAKKFMGKTPHDLKREAEEKVKILEEELKKLKGEHK
jgi:hypothetical protein